MKNDSLLIVKGVEKSFPGVKALRRVDFEVKKGEVHALMGENGAGKSTLIKILCGVYRKDNGKIIYEGKEVDFANPHQAQDAGVVPVYQELSLCENMNVAENIFIARQPLRSFLKLIDKKTLYSKTRKLLSIFHLDNISPTDIVADLPVSIRQQIEILKAVSMEPKLLVLDEPTSALGMPEIKHLFQLIRRLKEKGIGIVYVSHKIEEVLQIADRISVLRDGDYVGTVIASKTAESQIIKMMIGRELHSLYPDLGKILPHPVFEVKGLTSEKVKDITFKVFKGEILGFAGLVGAGRTEMARAIFGIDPAKKGSFFLEGKEIKIFSPMHAIKLGIGYVPEDRKTAGLFLKMGVNRNVVASILGKISRYGFVNSRLELAETKKYVELLKIKTSDYEQEVESLSGGNQQKVLLAKWLAVNPKVLLVDEPTRGIDVGTKGEIHFLLRKLASRGIGIIMISSELPEVLGMSDRIIVMHEGKIIGEFLNSNGQVDQEIIMTCISKASSNKNKM